MSALPPQYGKGPVGQVRMKDAGDVSTTPHLRLRLGLPVVLSSTPSQGLGAAHIERMQYLPSPSSVLVPNTTQSLPQGHGSVRPHPEPPTYYMGYPGGPPMVNPHPVYHGMTHLPTFPRLPHTDGAFLDTRPSHLSQYVPQPAFRPPSSLVQSPLGGGFGGHPTQWQITETRRGMPQDEVWRTTQHGLDLRHVPYGNEYYESAYNSLSDLRTPARLQHTSDLVSVRRHPFHPFSYFLATAVREIPRGCGQHKATRVPRSICDGVTGEHNRLNRDFLFV